MKSRVVSTSQSRANQIFVPSFKVSEIQHPGAVPVGSLTKVLIGVCGFGFGSDGVTQAESANISISGMNVLCRVIKTVLSVSLLRGKPVYEGRESFASGLSKSSSIKEMSSIFSAMI